MDCPRLYPLRLLQRKWSYLTLRALLKPLRFSELKTELKYITNRVLSKELSTLEEEGVVEKEEDRYRLTEAGKELLEALEPLVEWSVKHKDMPFCPPSQDCSRCSRYKEVIDVRL